MSKLTRTALAIETDLLKSFDKWMHAHGYTNRSKAVRDLMRGALAAEQWADPGAEVIATVSIIYDHDAHTLPRKLAGIQHEDHHAVLCSQHVHLDHDRCLEVILLHGPAGRLRRLTDASVAARGVVAGKLTIMSAG